MLLVGDPYQLQSVDAGGAFALLVDRRTDAPELTEIHRFANEWEKHASLALRRGEVEVISTYVRQKRIREGVTDEMLDAAYEAWRADCAAGKASILVTESSHAVRALNERARAERLLLDGAVDGREVDLADGSRASVGDIVITRRNDRTHPDDRAAAGSRTATAGASPTSGATAPCVVDRLDPRRRGETVLPAEYVAEHVDLGYAVTAHRAQGITVDTSHVVVTPSTTRENLYVSMTRGRDSNIAYVALDQPDDSHSTPEPDDVTRPHRALRRAPAQRRRACPRTRRSRPSTQLHGGIDRLAAELETIAAEAQHDRFVELLRRSGLTPEQHAAVVESTRLRPAHRGAPPSRGLPPRSRDDSSRGSSASTGSTTPTTSPPCSGTGSSRLAASPPRGCRLRPRLIAGLIPEPLDRQSALRAVRTAKVVADATRSLAAPSVEVRSLSSL